MKKDITGAQVRAGRALIDWSRETLAERCQVTVCTLTRVEAEETEPRAGTLAAIRGALEAAGVEFIAENGGRRGCAWLFGLETVTSDGKKREGFLLGN